MTEGMAAADRGMAPADRGMAPADRGMAPVDGWDVLERAGELARQGQAFALATVVWRQGPSSGQQGSRAIITAAGGLQGWIGGACAEPVVIREAQQVIAAGVPRLLLLGTSEQFGAAVPEGMTVVPISCQSEGALEVYIESVLPVPHLVVVGRSPMAQTLAALAGALGWRTALLDGPDFSAADADERSMVVVATQGHGDEEAIEEAIAARPAYLGLVGSSRRVECPPSSSAGSRFRPASTSAGRRTGKSPSRSWRSWSSCVLPGNWQPTPRPGRPAPPARPPSPDRPARVSWRRPWTRSAG